MLRGSLLVLCSLAVATVAAAQEPPELVADAPETDCVDAVARIASALEAIAVPPPPGLASIGAVVDPTPSPPAVAPRPAPTPPPTPAPVTRAPPPAPIPPPAAEGPVPSGRAVAALSEAACLAVLHDHRVPFERLSSNEADGVGIPIRLHGPIAGIRVESRGHSELHEILDCRLAVAVLSWAPALRAAGVEALLHYSVFRPGAHVAGTSRRSGHASALAIDLAVLVMDDGTEHEVLTGWEARERGAPPCDQAYDEGPESARMRSLVCSVAASELFQVVLTPHYDAAHANHVHLELRPDVPWQYLR